MENLERDENSNEVTLKKDTTIQFKTVYNPEGKIYLPIFTDWNALSKWSQEKEQTFFIKISDTVSMLEKDSNLEGIVINPYQENIVANLPMLLSLFQQHREYTVKEETPIEVGEHANPPHKLIAALKAYLPTIPTVKSAYLLRMNNQGNVSHLVIVDTNEREKDFPLIGNFCSDYLVPGEYVDLILKSDSLAVQTIDKYTPFYTQEKKGLFNFFKR